MKRKGEDSSSPGMNSLSPTDLGQGRSSLSQVSWNRSRKMTLSFCPTLHSRESCHESCISTASSFLECFSFALGRIFLSSTTTKLCLCLSIKKKFLCSGNKNIGKQQSICEFTCLLCFLCAPVPHAHFLYFFMLFYFFNPFSRVHDKRIS